MSPLAMAQLSDQKIAPKMTLRATAVYVLDTLVYFIYFCGKAIARTTHGLYKLGMLLT
jgi:hypothetical protein